MSGYEICEKLGVMMRIAGERGAILAAGPSRPNAMTIGWCMSGVMWGKSVLLAPVRTTRYTHELIEKHGEFTVFAPTCDFKKETAYLGSHSGRDGDKLAGLGVKTAPSQYVAAPCIAAKGYVAHCRVLYKRDMSADNLDAALCAQWYSGGANELNFHTLYFAEVVAITENV